MTAPASPLVAGVDWLEVYAAVRPVLDRHPMIDSSAAHKLDIQAGWIVDALRALASPGDGSSADADTHRAAEGAVVDHMVSRFLMWRLPENFNPDNGISFKPTFNDHMDPPMRCNPTGTNLFDRTQSEVMVRYMLEGLEQ